MATPAKNQDLHGNVPDASPVVLILIDVINDFEFDGAEPIFRQLQPVVENIVRLRARARQAGVPVIYVNDNFGKWQSDFQKLLHHCLHDPVRGRPVAQRLQPDPDDYFVLKPKHSAFYSTTLEVLLDYLQAQTLVLAGITGNICVLFTAHDAYMRDYELVIPQDCIASESKAENRRALQQMEKILKADTTAAADLDFGALLKKAARPARKNRKSHR